MKTVRIGVLGGIGPEATGCFYTQLITRLQEEGLIENNLDFPQIVINSIPAPELVFDKIGGEDMRPYLQGLKELDAMGLDFIVMVCNTVHLYYDTLQSEIGTRIIDLRFEVRRKLKELNVREVTVVGTPSTISQGLYEFPGITYHNPGEKEAKILGEAVFNFNKGVDKRAQANNALRIIDKYFRDGAKLAILACTEFAVMCADQEIPSIDTIEVLVDVVIREFKMLKKH